MRLLDRPGGRQMLAVLATAYARRRSKSNVRFLFDRGWTRQLDADAFVVDGETFAYFAEDMVGYEEFADRKRRAWFLVYSPQPGDTIVEVGSGCGADALVFSRAVGPRGKVIAIEAQPTTFGLLQHTCTLSKLNNVTCVNVAASDANGMARIECKRSHEENRLVLEEGAVSETAAVPARRLDDLLDELRVGKIDFLKMNIEGAERLALDGMARTLARTRHICIACHDFIADATGNDWYRTRDFVISRLRAAGFSLTLQEGPNTRPPVRDQIHGARPAD
jgi:FkbM family methyltransferase